MYGADQCNDRCWSLKGPKFQKTIIELFINFNIIEAADSQSDDKKWTW